jgi:hydrogenase maturation protease
VDEVVVIGVGNPERGDDAVGPEVVAHLEGFVPPGVRLATTSGSDPATVMGLWEGADRVILVDAMVSGAAAGTVERFDAAAGPLPHNVRLVSTHALGAGMAMEMARALGRLPERMSVYGIEGCCFDVGADLSPRVAGAVPVAAGMILEELAGATVAVIDREDR